MFRRCAVSAGIFVAVFFKPHRLGGLDGRHDSVKWTMIRHITVTTPNTRRRNTEMFDSLMQPKVRLASVEAIRQCYIDWGLRRR